MDRIVETAFLHAEKFALRRAGSAQQERFVRLAFRSLRSKQGTGVCVRVPVLLLRALGGDSRREIPLASASTLFYAGIDLFDDIADGDFEAAEWEGAKPAEANLAAATLFFSMTSLALSEMAKSASEEAKLQAALARGFLAMAAGQQTDLALAGAADVSADAAESAAIGKTGGEIALFAELAGIAAGLSAKRLEACRRFGSAYGTAIQLASDCRDLFAGPWSRDLASANRTLPLALHIEYAPDGEARRGFLGLLERARSDAAAQQEVRSALVEAGVLRKMAVIVEMYRAEAMQALMQLKPREPAASELTEYLRRASLLEKPAAPE